MQLSFFEITKSDSKKLKIKPLKDSDENYCRSYVATSGDSFKSYVDSNKHIIKVNASKKLTDINIIIRILQIREAKPSKTEFEKTFFEKRSKYQSEFNNDFIDDFISILASTSKGLDNIKKLMCIYSLFDLLDRDYFTRRVERRLREEYEYFKKLHSANRMLWNGKWNKLVKDLKAYGITVSIKNIINQNDSSIDN